MGYELLCPRYDSVPWPHTWEEESSRGDIVKRGKNGRESSCREKRYQKRSVGERSSSKRGGSKSRGKEGSGECSNRKVSVLET